VLYGASETLFSKSVHGRRPADSNVSCQGHVNLKSSYIQLFCRNYPWLFSFLPSNTF